MDDERWRRTSQRYHAALQRQKAVERHAFVACRDDAVLTDRIESLLANDAPTTTALVRNGGRCSRSSK
jgi:hypothetical protein